VVASVRSTLDSVLDLIMNRAGCEQHAVVDGCVGHRVLAEHGECVSNCLQKREYTMSGVAGDAWKPGRWASAEGREVLWWIGGEYVE
jgi:hypothetical protein